MYIGSQAKEPAERLEILRQQIEEFPLISLRALGQPWGISRERVRQILKEAGIEKSHAKHWDKRGMCQQGHKKGLTKEAFYVSRSRTGIFNIDNNQSRCFQCKPIPWYSTIDKNTGLQTSRIVAVACDYCGEISERKASTTYQRRWETEGAGSRYKGHHFCGRPHFHKYNAEVRQWWSASPIYQRMLERKKNGESFSIAKIIAEYKKEMNPTTFQKFKGFLNNIRSPFIAGLI